MITQELVIWTVLSGLTLALSLVYLGLTIGDLRYQKHRPDGDKAWLLRIATAEMNLQVAAVLLLMSAAATFAAIVALARANRYLLAQAWGQAVVYSLIVMLLGIGLIISVKLVNRRAINRIE